MNVLDMLESMFQEQAAEMPVPPAPDLQSNEAPRPLPLKDAHRGNLLLTPEQAEACHSPAWTEAEIAAFTARSLWFISRGLTARTAEHLAERKTLCDRQGDDRRFCVECGGYRGGCLNWRAAGMFRGAWSEDRGPEPVILDQLRRCPAFSLAASLREIEPEPQEWPRIELPATAGSEGAARGDRAKEGGDA